MKIVTKILTALLLTLSLLHANAFEKVVESNTAKVIITSEKPLSVGDNRVKLNITSVEYKDAEVSVKAFMPAMPGMPAMQSTSDAKNLGNGNYEAELNLSMSGTWQIHIFITSKSGKKTRVKTSVNI